MMLPLPATRAAAAFLGVERSVTGRVWRDRLDERATQPTLTPREVQVMELVWGQVVVGGLVAVFSK